MTNVRLLPATVTHLVALKSDPTAFGRLIGSPVPEGWPVLAERRRAHDKDHAVGGNLRKVTFVAPPR